MKNRKFDIIFTKEELKKIGVKQEKKSNYYIIRKSKIKKRKLH